MNITPPQRDTLKKLREKMTGDPQFNDDIQQKRAGKNSEDSGQVRMVASSSLPTRFGNFTLWGFRSSIDNEEYSVISRGNILNAAHCPVRLHSCCHTGDVLSSLRCDCQQQLHAAQRYIQRHNCGLIVHLPQEGRGIGLINKIKTYHLQDLGLDTAEANEYLGFAIDERDYTIASQILRWFQPRSVRVMTNNPEKIICLQQHGITVSGRISLRVRTTRHNRDYLRTKRAKFKHVL